MKKNSKIIVISIIALICIAVAVLLIYTCLRNRKKGTFEPIGDSCYYAYQVESASIDGDYVVIKGWFFELNKIRNIAHKVDLGEKLGVVVYNMEKETKSYNDGSGIERTGIAADVKLTDRTDINAYFKCEYDYTRCGFEAKIKKSKLDVNNGKYQILIKPDETEPRAVQAAFLVNGQLRYTNPLDDMVLNVSGTDLERIVNEGICVVSYPNAHICVYQYGWQLYWIADKDFVFEKDGSTKLEYGSETTQFDKLPIPRINDNKYYDEMPDYFERYEVTDSINCGEYRVAVRDLPSNYAITQLVTGYRIKDNWEWRSFFRPDYRLR